MDVRGAYAQWADTYDSDRNLTRDLDQAVTRQMLAAYHCDLIVEAGCGTGKNTPLLGDIGRRVLALDFTPAMIAQARAKPQPRHAQFAVADVTLPWPCAPGCADLVVCNLVLEHIRDLAPVFAEAQRVLKQGGRMFVCELHPFRQYQGKKATFQHNDQLSEIAAHVHHVSTFLSTAQAVGFRLAALNEWWHTSDEDSPPRLVSFVFEN